MLCPPESAMPWWPAEVVLSEEVTCEQGPTMKPIITYVAAVRRHIVSSVTLEQHVHQVRIDYYLLDVLTKMETDKLILTVNCTSAN
jgi:uncharacterized radical SAM superfamily protein